MATLPRRVTPRFAALRSESAILERLREGRPILLDGIRRALTKAARGVVSVEEAIGAVSRLLNPRASTKVLAGAPSLSRTPERVLGLLPGGAGYQARRILATETTRAHGEARRNLARERGYLLRWELSPLHKHHDECDGFADADAGFGRGVYRPDDAPPIPTHANCRCAYSVIRPDVAQLALMEGIAA